jgi:hypothetical protein
MLRRSLLLLPLLLGCGAEDSRDLVLYKAPLRQVEGRYHSRSLLVTGGLRALGVERNAAGGLWIREGEVESEVWEAVRGALEGQAGRRRDPASLGGRTGVFQIWARITREEISLRRDPAEPMTREVAGVRDRLEEIWEGLPEAGDPVGALLPYLASPLPRVRGHATQAVLSARKSPSLSAQARSRAEEVVQQRELVEDDPSIREMIRQALRKPSDG